MKRILMIKRIFLILTLTMSGFAIHGQAIRPYSQKKETGVINGHEWVDLGLSVKWATCNVGASTPADYGNYYAWGETSPKSYYGWKTYFDSPNDSPEIYSFRIYNNNGGKTKIAPDSGHDTARENWGGTWRLPTLEELNELVSKCKWVKISRDGHIGYQGTGPNGQRIFLPAAGFRYEKISYDDFSFYMSSTLDSYAHSAWVLRFDYNPPITTTQYRYEGISVRPVTD